MDSIGIKILRECIEWMSDDNAYCPICDSPNYSMESHKPGCLVRRGREFLELYKKGDIRLNDDELRELFERRMSFWVGAQRRKSGG